MDYIVAMENLISHLVNRKVPKTRANYPVISSLKDLLDGAISSSPNEMDRRDAKGNLRGIDMGISIYGEGEPGPAQMRALAKASSNIAKVRDLIIERWIKNQRNKTGDIPWAWADIVATEDQLRKDARDNLLIETVHGKIFLKDVSYEHKATGDVSVEFWFNTTSLYGYHVLIVTDCTDPKTGALLPIEKWNMEIGG